MGADGLEQRPDALLVHAAKLGIILGKLSAWVAAVRLILIALISTWTRDGST